MAEKIARPQLGEWRTFSAEAYRARIPQKWGVTRKEWRASPMNTPARGMFIGFRTVFNGVTEWIGEEEGYSYSFDHSTHREVWMFVKDARSKPVYVFPECVEAQS